MEKGECSLTLVRFGRGFFYSVVTPGALAARAALRPTFRVVARDEPRADPFTFTQPWPRAWFDHRGLLARL